MLGHERVPMGGEGLRHRARLGMLHHDCHFWVKAELAAEQTKHHQPIPAARLDAGRDNEMAQGEPSIESMSVRKGRTESLSVP